MVYEELTMVISRPTIRQQVKPMDVLFVALEIVADVIVGANSETTWLGIFTIATSMLDGSSESLEHRHCMGTVSSPTVIARNLDEILNLTVLDIYNVVVIGFADVFSQKSNKYQNNLMKLLKMQFILTTLSSLSSRTWYERYWIHHPLLLRHKPWEKVVNIRKTGWTLLNQIRFTSSERCDLRWQFFSRQMVVRKHYCKVNQPTKSKEWTWKTFVNYNIRTSISLVREKKT